MSQNNLLYPSTFYALFEGARNVTLIFMADGDSVGPYWHEDGNLDFSRGQHQADECAAVVSLGADHYRLAECCDGPLSGLRLHWGDEFIASPHGDDELVHRSTIADFKISDQPGGPIQLAGWVNIQSAPTDRRLVLQKVLTPRKFVSYRFLTSVGFNSENPIAQLLHSLGGGWETVAGGVLTLTVPVEMEEQFNRRMESDGLCPGVITLGD